MLKNFKSVQNFKSVKVHRLKKEADKASFFCIKEIPKIQVYFPVTTMRLVSRTLPSPMME